MSQHDNTRAVMTEEQVRITVTVPAIEKDAVVRLMEDYQAGKVRACTPPIALEGTSYHEAACAVMRDEQTSYTLRARINEDERRDPVDAIADAELQLALATRRLNDGEREVRSLSPSLLMEHRGCDALKRLQVIAQGGGQDAEGVARFLLALYDGHRFPFNFSIMDAWPMEIFEDSMRLLRTDVTLQRPYVATFFGGAAVLDNLALRFSVIDFKALVPTARMLADSALDDDRGRELSCLVINMVNGVWPL